MLSFVTVAWLLFVCCFVEVSYHRTSGAETFCLWSISSVKWQSVGSPSLINTQTLHFLLETQTVSVMEYIVVLFLCVHLYFCRIVSVIGVIYRKCSTMTNIEYRERYYFMYYYLLQESGTVATLLIRFHSGYVFLTQKSIDIYTDLKTHTTENKSTQ